MWGLFNQNTLLLIGEKVHLVSLWVWVKGTCDFFSSSIWLSIVAGLTSLIVASYWSKLTHAVFISVLFGWNIPTNSYVFVDTQCVNIWAYFLILTGCCQKVSPSCSNTFVKTIHIFLFFCSREEKISSVMLGTNCSEWSKQHVQRQLSFAVDVSHALVDKFSWQAQCLQKIRMRFIGQTLKRLTNINIQKYLHRCAITKPLYVSALGNV